MGVMGEISVNFFFELDFDSFLLHRESHRRRGGAPGATAAAVCVMRRRTPRGVASMAKDVMQGLRLDDLTDAEIERIEGELFCAGGPPEALTPALLFRASLTQAPPRGRPRYA
jgi:hypothetical protein